MDDYALRKRGQMDQEEAKIDEAIGRGATVIANYYKALLAGGVPDGLAYALTMRFQELTLGASHAGRS